jgi:MFS-type transporter involved in bile tolerance (Atg22 family)
MASTSLFELICCDPIQYFDESEHLTDSVLEDSVTYEEQDKKREKDEVMGWTFDASARGVTVIGASVFVSTALLKLAKEAAGCETASQDNDDAYVVPDCNEKIFGMRPTSLLTNILMVSSLVSASLMPLVGSIIDHTAYRRTVGRASAACLITLICLQIFSLKHAWFLAAVIQVAIAFIYSVHLCATYAYLPELTNHPETLVAYTSRFTAAQYGASVVFLVLMVAILSYMGLQNGQEVLAAQVSQTSIFFVTTVFFGIAWSKLFKKRDALHSVPKDMTLVNAGFRKLFRTTKSIALHHNSLKWFLLSASMTQSATTAFSSIAITFMTEQLKFGPSENAIAILLFLVFAVPGASLAQILASWLNPIRSLRCCLCLWMVTTGTAAFVLRGKGQEITAYGFAVVWGLCIGWVYPTEKALYCSIIPRGQDAELMGVYIFACQILSWLPPFVFTALNESGFSMRAGLFSLNGSFFVSFWVLQALVGDYHDAVQHASTFHEKDEDTDYVTISETSATSTVSKEPS